MSNVIVFMSDEHNPRYSSPYGHPFVDTPNMQWLADNGTVFEHAYCPSPLCVPSRSAFLTGKRVHAVGAYGNNRLGIPPETHGLGAVLGPLRSQTDSRGGSSFVSFFSKQRLCGS